VKGVFLPQPVFADMVKLIGALPWAQVNGLMAVVAEQAVEMDRPEPAPAAAPAPALVKPNHEATAAPTKPSRRKSARA